jgi:hemolysin activation/secretion protein
VSLARVEAARIAILRRYRDDGYALTAVSAIAEAGGLLRLRVTEGRIAAVRLDGDIGPAGVQVLRFLQHLTEPRVIDTATLERWLLLAGDVPGVTLRAVLRQSTDETGALTLIAQVTRQSWGGQVTLDNRAFDRVGPEQGLAAFDLNSFTAMGEHTQFELYRTINGAQLFGQIEADAFIGASGLRIRLTAGSGLSRPTGPFRSIGYIGRTTTLGAELAYPLIRSRRQTLNLAAGFDAEESDIEQAGQLASHDSLRILRAGLDYALSDTLLGDARGGTTTVSLRLSHGLSILGASRDGAALAGRAGQQNGFLKANLELSRTQTLFQPWEGASVALFGLVAGQWTNDVLPPAEKFFLGGSRFTRGFYFGQVTGDKALAATAELQLNAAAELPLFGRTIDLAAQLYAFYDWGATWETPPEDRGRRLGSVGLGLRLIPAQKFELDVELVRRLTRFPTGSGAGIAPLPAHAIYWRLVARF